MIFRKMGLWFTYYAYIFSKKIKGIGRLQSHPSEERAALKPYNKIHLLKKPATAVTTNSSGFHGGNEC